MYLKTGDNTEKIQMAQNIHKTRFLLLEINLLQSFSNTKISVIL
jgi:hypothetical protein